MYTKLVRIGRDAEMKYLSTGTAVLEMSAVYDIGFGDNKKPQWIKIAMFGQRAEKLVQHFTKGKQIVATMDDVKSEAWIDKNSNEAKSGLSAKLVEFEFAGGQSPQQGGQQQQNAPQQQQAPKQHAPQMAPAYQQPGPQQMQPPAQSWGTPPAQMAPQQPGPAYQQAPHQEFAKAGQGFDDDLPF